MTTLQAQKEQQAAAAAEAQAPEGEGPPAAVDTSVSDEDIKVQACELVLLARKSGVLACTWLRGLPEG